jgi:hypothetical protein
MHIFKFLHRKHGSDGVWAVFRLLQQKKMIQLLAQGQARDAREQVLAAAISADHRMSTLVDATLQLRDDWDFDWPDFYVQTIHTLLKEKDYDRAIFWHLRLYQNFSNSPDVLGGLLSGFVTDSSKSLQSTLTSLYVFSKERNLYDSIIPVLFESGQSRLARAWRKKLVQFQDMPLSSRSRPFIRFLVQFYPATELTREEIQVMGNDTGFMKNSKDEAEPLSEQRGAQANSHDNIVAKWFATSWMPAEFAINLVHRLGLATIGPRSLQSLALREPDPKSVMARVTQLERLGMRISQSTYCKALLFFAKKEEEKLLYDLLHCDVHPEEFDNTDTRHMLMANAAREKDWAQEKLFQGVEWAIENSSTPTRLNYVLNDILQKRNSLGKAKIVLDRMSALRVGMSQNSADALLDQVFSSLDEHPRHWNGKFSRPKFHSQSLDGAIQVTRRVASHEVAIPIRHWQALLYGLGRCGRLEELRQLSLEIIRIFKPTYRRLVPLHQEDLPQLTSEQPNDGGQEESRHNWNAESSQKTTTPETSYLPTDVPFEHREHPLRKIFDPALQRAIIRWGFDQAMSGAPAGDSLVRMNPQSIAEADLAGGIRLLRSLRDEGVWVDEQLIRSNIMYRLAVGQISARPKDRSRDSHELSAENLKQLTDEAWGSEVLPSISEMNKEIDRRRPRLWKRYPKLLNQAFVAS